MAVNKLFVFINLFIQFENPCTTLHYLVWSHFLFPEIQTCDLGVDIAMHSNTHHYSEKCNTSVATRWWLFSCWPVLITCTRHHIIHSVQCILNIDRYTLIPLRQRHTHTQQEGKVCLVHYCGWPQIRQGSLAFLPASFVPRWRVADTVQLSPLAEFRTQHAYSSWAEKGPRNCDGLSEGETSLCQRGLKGCPASQRVCVGVWV